MYLLHGQFLLSTICSNAYLVPCNILNIYNNVLHIGTPSIVHNYYGTTSSCNRNKARLAEILLK